MLPPALPAHLPMDQELRDALGKIEGKIDKLGDKYDRILLGNGQPGLMREVDRLSEANRLHNWILGTTVTAVIAGAVHTLWQIIVH